MPNYFKSNGPAAISPPLFSPDPTGFLLLNNSRSIWVVEPNLFEASTPNERGWADYLPQTTALKNLEITWHDNDQVNAQHYWPPAGFLLPGQQIIVALRQANQARRWILFWFTTVQRLVHEQTPPTVPVWRLITVGGRIFPAPSHWADYFYQLGGGGSSGW